MKKSIVLFLFLFVSFTAYSQLHSLDVMAFQKELNESYKNPDSSPLSTEDREIFQHHDFFPVDEEYLVTASLNRSNDDSPVFFETSGEIQQEYRTYGIAKFTLKGKEYKLTIFQNQLLLKNPIYKDNLFLAFFDLTNGETTYGGGRYIDLKIPKSNTIVIDFNKAYNPYCAYSDNYSCPIPPSQNTLDVEVKAGIKYNEEQKIPVSEKKKKNEIAKALFETLGINQMFANELLANQDQSILGQFRHAEIVKEMPVVQESLVAIYANTFTLTELEAIHEFYNSPLGSSILKKEGTIEQSFYEHMVKFADKVELTAQSKADSTYQTMISSPIKNCSELKEGKFLITLPDYDYTYDVDRKGSLQIDIFPEDEISEAEQSQMTISWEGCSYTLVDENGEQTQGTVYELSEENKFKFIEYDPSMEFHSLGIIQPLKE